MESSVAFFPFDFPLTFTIWYGNNKHLKESLVFQTKSLYSKNPFLPSIIRNSYPQYLILHLLVQWYRAQSVQVTVSTLKSIEVLLCLLIKPFLSWYLRPQTVQKKTMDGLLGVIAMRITLTFSWFLYLCTMEWKKQHYV